MLPSDTIARTDSKRDTEKGLDVTIPPASAKSASGMQLKLLSNPTEAGRVSPLRFQVIGADGAPVTDYDVVHERSLHMFALRDGGKAAATARFSDFQHLHPSHIGKGVWEINDFAVPASGATRIVADLTSRGEQQIAQATFDVAAGAAYAPRDRSGGFTAKVVHSMPMQNAVHAVVELRDAGGKPVTSVKPYLGAAGHWALFNTGSTDAAPVGVAHAHPMGGLKDGKLEFHVVLPESGAYSGWLQFQPDGQELLTVPLTVGPGGGGHGPGHGGGGHGPHNGHVPAR